MANAYIYRAALYCEGCTDEIKAILAKQGKVPAEPEDEYSYDSDDYPKGPFENGGGEADTPQHCNRCNCFLENPLTPDGKEWLRGEVIDGIPPEWAEFYEDVL